MYKMNEYKTHRCVKNLILDLRPRKICNRRHPTISSFWFWRLIAPTFIIIVLSNLQLKKRHDNRYLRKK